MNIIYRGTLTKEVLPGRIIQKAVGKDAYSRSGKMTMGFASYCAEAGETEPHRHAEEIVYVVSADKGFVRYGASQDDMTTITPLETGMTLHIPELQWHVFEYGEGGHVDIIFFYGQTENIRPEEICTVANEKRQV